MVIFTGVRYSNFLASGNAPIYIPLDKHAASLIVGRNGAGKSTMSEAICFALFGRPLRKINKPKLVNSINQRDCLVELDFRVGQVNYRIRRGIKPSIFEIYENGNLIPAPASLDDYQTMLETNIVNLTYKSFLQVVVLGSASYVPFMRLTPASRREIIEDLLDIGVFSSMNALTKDDTISIRHELDKTTQAKTLIAEQRKMAQSFNEHIEEQQKERIAELEKRIVAHENEIDVQEDKLETLSIRLGDYTAVREQLATANTNIAKYTKTLNAIKTKDREFRKEREFYETHDSCPTCEQDITEEFKANRFTYLDEKSGAAVSATAQCQARLDQYTAAYRQAEQELEGAVALEREIHKTEIEISTHKRHIAELKRAIQTESQPRPQQKVASVDDLDKQLDALDATHADLSKRRVIVEAATMLLKDNGIKARIIRHYLPIINRTINAYLNAMDFPILFTLDEEFSEQIKSRHRDEFAYDSFSEGEKKRIDLALLLTWRAVAALKNSASTNLLILDEVFDGSLDAAGTEEFLKIIAGLEQGTNIFVISHKMDQLVDKFANIIVFEKQRGFSQLQDTK